MKTKKPTKTKKTEKKDQPPPVSPRRPGRVMKDRHPHNVTWLKAQLLIAGISQRDIAAELGADFSTVNHLIAGRRPLRDEDIQVIAGMLRMPVGTFLAKLRAETPPSPVEGLEKAAGAGELPITGWVDGELTVHEGKPNGPASAPSLPGAEPVKVVRCQTQGSAFDGIDGALVYYRTTGGVPVAPEAMGRMCVVETTKGDSLLRVVKRGYSDGKFNLSKLNGVLSESDTSLRSAHQVLWLKL